MPYTNLKSFSRKELQEIVRELQEECNHNEKTIKSFYNETKLLKQEFYSLHDKHQLLIKRVENAEEFKDKILEVLATNPTQPVQMINQLIEALDVAKKDTLAEVLE